MHIKKYFGGLVLAAGLANVVAADVADNKDTAVNAMIDLFARQDPTGVDRYFETKAPYIQHNTGIPDGIDTLRGLAQMATSWKGVHTVAYRAVGAGDWVVLQSSYRNLGGREMSAVAFDLFHFKDGKIFEHFDALEPGIKLGFGGVSQVNGARDITDLDKSDDNRKVVLSFIDTVLVAGKPENAGKFIDKAVFVSHNLHDGDGLQRKFASFVGTAADAKPVVQYTKAHRTIAEGNFIFVQGEGKIPAGKFRALDEKPAGDMLEIYDLYRLKAGKIVEHWDVLQPLAPPSQWANKNGPF